MKAKLFYLLFLNTSYSDVKRLFTVFIKFFTNKFRYIQRLDEVFTIMYFNQVNLHKYIHKNLICAPKIFIKKRIYLVLLGISGDYRVKDYLKPSSGSIIFRRGMAIKRGLTNLGYDKSSNI